MDLAWYDELRNQQRPPHLRVLLVAESPPDPGSGERRFFYSPRLAADNLYRGVAEAVYGQEPGFQVRDKAAVLSRLREDGYWLIDAVDRPINKTRTADRRRAIAAAAPRLVERIAELAPELGIIICHGQVYKAVAPPLRKAGLPLLHDEPLPFPLGNWRAEFVAGMRKALASA